MAESTLGVGRPTKRRRGAAVGGLPVADPRPALVGGRVRGSRCTACGYATSQTGGPWCAACHGELASEDFAGTGAVWSSTVVHIPVGERKAPFGLAYVDLDDGPRVLVHLREPAVLAPATRVRIAGQDRGDLIADVIEERRPS